MRVVAMEERAEALLALGHHHRVIPELERLVADHPLRERPVSLLMQALFATGRQADALRAFQSFRTRLADETGLDPSDELVALERSMASGRPVATSMRAPGCCAATSVHEVLGEGAFGRVFAATQPGTNREVAIKAIRPDLADEPEFIQRFEAEAQLVARLEHPHIVPLYDYWREPGGAYLVFRLLLGGTAFAAMVSDGPFSVARVSRLVEEVGGALLAAHTAGVVHCDIKPSNVMFDEAGNAYLSDFGIAVTSSTLGQSGDRTRAYAAPELVDRTGDTVRSDIFSFGCMLWELLTGRSPLSVMQSDDSVRACRAWRARSPSHARRSTPCSPGQPSTDPEVRFESMAELIVAWRDAVGRPEGVLTPIGSPSSSSPRLVAAPRRARPEHRGVSASVNPYKGLRAFAEADAADFFGRDDVAAAAASRPLIARASSRSSARPGPARARSCTPASCRCCAATACGSRRWCPAIDRSARCVRRFARSPRPTATPTIRSSWLIEAAREGAGHLVLVVDQFEECWTLADDSSASAS